MNTLRILILLLVGSVFYGCAPAELAVRPVSYDVDARLTTRTHTLEAEVTIELERLELEPIEDS